MRIGTRLAALAGTWFADSGLGSGLWAISGWAGPRGRSRQTPKFHVCGQMDAFAPKRTIWLP